MDYKRLAKSVFARLALFAMVFGPATITAMADNDASGVATYSIAGATLGYPILFTLFFTTILLAVTQEMGVRVSLVTRKGLGDLIRENYGVAVSLFIFALLFVANIGTLTVELAAFKTTASLLRLPSLPLVILLVAFTCFFVIKGNYKLTQNIMLIASFFYLTYIFSAFKSGPDWGKAITNIFLPTDIKFNGEYLKNYIVIGLGVIGTTITPWGQFFISSFGLDKKIGTDKLKYSQLETYWGAFLTDFFSFFMIVATAATLFVNGINLTDGSQAALAIEPFAGKLAATLFALGIMNAGFMGLVIVSLSTTYAFSEFFGFSGSLDTSYEQSKTFYMVFFIQIAIAFFLSLIPSIKLFDVAVITQIINAMALPPIFYYLIKFTNDPSKMGKYSNTPLQRWIAYAGTGFILAASVFTVIVTIFKI